MTGVTIDRRTGQAYREIIIHPSKHADGHSWVHESPFLPKGWEETSRAGAPSLQHCAMKRLLSDQRSLRPEIFAYVPWHIASYLWDCLGKSKRRTLHSWKLFATAYPEQFREVSPYRSYSVRSVELGMPEYWQLVSSDALSWRVLLTLDPSIARIPDLVEIANIQNLVALEISSPPQAWNSGESSGVTLSNRVIRSWSELQQSSGAFAHLRVLVLYRQRDLSEQILQYLRRFPSLEIVLALDCGNLTRTSRDDFQVEGWLVDPGSRQGVALYEQYLLVTQKEAKRSTGLDTAPILNFEINPSQTVRKAPMKKEKMFCFYRDGSNVYKHERESGQKRPRGHPQMKNKRPDKYRKIGWEGLLEDLT
ncbi:hypothetical protein AbraIFM66951_005407 [Aspergillus brasiliensis]|uniref:Uncharacterized protein n=1 Tax=Aspergillus brasiliensis TaxID=319629 RepID=A0A9W5YQ08_9EURO|nr:hypothetical protein AbraCBS73388_006283 [Aspergillus brasiliensis]GKZ43840.1 hypothetical protein AbraIFM66951_005407 [Aspergillus brasiliensis]